MRAHHTHNLYSIGDIYTTKQTITKYGYGLPRRWYLRHSRHQLFVSMVVLYICAILPINKSLVCNRFVRFFAYHAIAWQLQQLLLWAMLLLLLVCNVASRTFHCLLPHLFLFRFSIHIQMQFFFSSFLSYLAFINVCQCACSWECFYLSLSLSQQQAAPPQFGMNLFVKFAFNYFMFWPCATTGGQVVQQYCNECSQLSSDYDNFANVVYKFGSTKIRMIYDF